LKTKKGGCSSRKCLQEVKTQLTSPSNHNAEGYGVGVVLVSPHEQVLEYDIHFKFSTINNLSEYIALLTRLGLVEALEAFPLHIHNDP